MVMRALPALIWMLPLARMILPGNYDNPVLTFILPGARLNSLKYIEVLAGAPVRTLA
jgi:hypothetical protein